MSSLFETTHNPDVLSCIANLSSDEVFTPPELVNQMLDMLPDELWSDPNATFLDPACKSGVFLREIAKRLISGLENEIPELEKRLEHIYKKQLYGIAITELTSMLSRRSLYCSKWPNSVYSVVKFDDPKGNVDYMKLEHSWEGGRCRFCGAAEREYNREEGLEQYAYEFIHLDNPEEVLPMKFDVIIGNPPYMLNDGGGSGTSAVPLYHKFIEQAIKLNPRYMAMIVPSRWFSGGKGLDAFRDMMLHSDQLIEIHDFIDASDCFPGVQIKGGVNYFLWSRDYRGNVAVTTHRGNEAGETVVRPLLEPNTDVFIRYNEAIDILDKVRGLKEGSFEEFVSARRPFGVLNTYPFSKTKNAGDILFYTHNGDAFAPRSAIERNELWVDMHKVFISKVGSGSDSFPHQILGMPFVGKPGTASAETFLVIGPFSSEQVCKNVISYISTRFFRFLVLLKKPSQNAPKGVYSFVPKQDFSRPWTDEELYAKYGLTDGEITFIESMIRPMDSTGDLDE